MEHVPGPDFPTGGIIMGRSGIRSAYLRGRGSIAVRGKIHVETIRKDRDALIVTEIPYQVNKAVLQERIARARPGKAARGNIRCPRRIGQGRLPCCDRAEARCSARRRVEPTLSFHDAAIGLRGEYGRLEWRPSRTAHSSRTSSRLSRIPRNVVTRRTKYLLSKARDRAHVLVGLPPPSPTSTK